MGSVIFRRPPLRRFRKEGSDLFGVDMHFHTRYSLDGISRITNIIKKVRKKNIGVAITDHNAIKGVQSAYKNRKGAIIIPGIEITCRNGVHMIAYFHSKGELEEFFSKRLKPRMKVNPFFTDIGVDELLQIGKDHSAIICAPHPFALGIVGLHKMKVTKKIEKALNMVEVINGYNFRRANMKAVYWASKINKGMTGGSDGHTTLELGKVLTFTTGTDIDSILKDMVKDRSVVIGREDNLFLKAAMTVRKESAYINRSKKEHKAGQLLRSQLGTEYRYLKSKFRHDEGRFRHLKQHHPFNQKTTASAINMRTRKMR
jgi:predicted metal-dependent phosphoesterase TrpH